MEPFRQKSFFYGIIFKSAGCLPTGSCTYHHSLSMISREADVTVMTGVFFGMGPESVCLSLKPSTLADMLFDTFADSRAASLTTSALQKTRAGRIRSPAVRDQCTWICNVHGCINYTEKYISFVVSY